MRAFDILYESDNRSKIQKLRDVIAHPTTEQTIKNVAQSKLDLLLLSELDEEEVDIPSRITVSTNLTEDDLDLLFIPGVPVYQIYRRLTELQPAPCHLHFSRPRVRMLVPPPFMGLTKQQYIKHIHDSCPMFRNVTCELIEGHGYLFSLDLV